MADKFCPGCGARNPEQTKFCTSCGAQIPAAPPMQQAMGQQPPPGQPFPPVGQPQPMAQPFSPAGQPGYPAQPYQAYPMPAPAPAPAPKKKRTGLIVFLSIVAFFALIVVAIVAAASGSLKKAAEADYYEVKNDQVPSIKYVLGETRKVTGAGTEIKNGMTISYWQYESDTPQQDIDAYLSALAGMEGYIRLVDPDTMEDTGYGRDSVDSGYHLEVTAALASPGYMVSVYYIQGQIEMLDEPTTQPENRSDPRSEPATRGVEDDTKFSDMTDYYSFGSDRVPTVKKVLGFRDVLSSADLSYGGTVSIQAEYSSDEPNQDAYDYALYLVEEESFISLADVTFSDPSGHAEFGRNAAKSGYMIVISVDFHSSGYTVKAEYEVGVITPYG